MKKHFLVQLAALIGASAFSPRPSETPAKSVDGQQSSSGNENEEIEGESQSKLLYQLIEGMPCSHSIEPGATSEGMTWTVGYHAMGAVVPEGTLGGVSCTEEYGCQEIVAGDVATANGTMILQAGPGAVFPDLAVGLIACSMPSGTACAAVESGTTVPGGSALIAMVTDAGMAAPGPGMWVSYEDPMNVVEMAKGALSPGPGIAIAFIDEEGVEIPTDPTAKVGMALQCPVDWSLVYDDAGEDALYPITEDNPKPPDTDNSAL